MLAIALLGCVAASTALWAEPTEVTVRVLSKDAKFVGSSMGGVLIVIRDADTGRILAEGSTTGSTGDTRKIMVDDRKRGVPLSTDDSAKFEATLDLDRPRHLSIEATGPMGQRQGANSVTITQWVVPGKHLTGGDGILLELPGLVVDVNAPSAHSRHKAPATLPIEANVTMMCGCPLTPDGLWDANQFEVRAWVLHNGEPAEALHMDLAYAGTASQFAANLEVTEPGVYEVLVYAYQASNGNTGLDKVTFLVSE
jgi:hypothetical protein